MKFEIPACSMKKQEEEGRPWLRKFYTATKAQWDFPENYGEMLWEAYIHRKC